MSIDDKACRFSRLWRRRPLIEMPVHALVVGCVLGVDAAVGVIHILAGLWKTCGIGINAGANSLTLLFLYAPAVTLSAGPGSALVFGILAKPTSRWSRTIGYGAALVVKLALAGVALLIGSDFGAEYPCPELQASPSVVARCWDR